MSWTKPYHPANNRHLDPELYQRAGLVTFITIRAYQNQCPFRDQPFNQMIIETLQEEQERLHCYIFTYCLMRDHLHYLIGPVSDGFSVLMFTDQLKGKTTNRSWKLGWRGKLWQPCCYDHIVRNDEDLRAIAEYILNNPVRKDLVPYAEEWQWSGHFTPLPVAP